MHGRVDFKYLYFLTWILYGAVCSVSHLRFLTPWEIYPDVCWVEESVSPSATLETVASARNQTQIYTSSKPYPK